MIVSGLGGANDPVIRGIGPLEDFSVSVTDATLVHASTVTNDTYLDMTRQTDAVTSADPNFKVNTSSPIGDSLVIENKTPSVCSIDAGGNVTRVVDGTAIIEVSAPGKGTRRITRDIRRLNTGEVITYTGFVAGSLSEHVASTINGYANGKTPDATTLTMFTNPTFSKTAPVGTIDAALWCSALDFSASSFMAGLAQNFPINLVSPRHGLFAKHIGYGTGTQVVWLDSAGVFHSANIQSQMNISGDVQLVYLDAAIPITPYSVLPANYATYLPSVTRSMYPYPRPLPILYRPPYRPINGAPYEQNVAVHVVDSIDITGQTLSYLNNGDSVPGWGKAVQGGDSSSPFVIPVNGVPALLASAYTSGYSAMYADLITEIESGMNALKDAGDATVYSLNKVDLTGFTSF